MAVSIAPAFEIYPGSGKVYRRWPRLFSAKRRIRRPWAIEGRSSRIASDIGVDDPAFVRSVADRLVDRRDPPPKARRIDSKFRLRKKRRSTPLPRREIIELCAHEGIIGSWDIAKTAPPTTKPDHEALGASSPSPIPFPASPIEAPSKDSDPRPAVFSSFVFRSSIDEREKKDIIIQVSFALPLSDRSLVRYWPLAPAVRLDLHFR